ncbi:MAG: hypothetical protein ABSD41_01905 [Candidatus Bathyarchaeia archaeon]|jgi:hypothetical protein
MSIPRIIVDIAVILIVASLLSFIIRRRGNGLKVNLVLLAIVVILIMMLVSMGKLLVSLLGITLLLAALVILLVGQRISASLMSTQQD